MKEKKSTLYCEDPYNIIHAVTIEKGKIVERTKTKIPWSAFYYKPLEKKKETGEKIRRIRRRQIHPLLRRWLRRRAPETVEQLIISFHEEFKIPRFPDLDPNEARKSEKNQKVLSEVEERIKEIQERRDEFYDRWLEENSKKYRIEVINRFWLINALTVAMPLEAVKQLAMHKEIIYIEPRYSGEKPPSNPNPNDDVDDGIRRIVSDPYFNLGLTGGYIGLLDTGIRSTHTIFNNPSNIDFLIDCTGDNDPDDDCWNHGTSSAAIISGNNRMGNAFRGVTAITLDSLKVYPAGCGGLDSSAAVDGFERAVRILDRVIVAEMQGGGDQYCAISRAADNAYDSGAVIIAANGNNGSGAGSVNAPANAHRVIGVGNFDVQTMNQVASQSRGPTSDNRFKPDIQAPTNTETASNANDNAFRIFSGTSGATPYAAGAAALLRNWLRGSNFSIDPGQVYAQMILSGQNPYPFNNTIGAGPIELPTDGWAWWGKVSVSDGMTIDIPLRVSSSTANTFDAALWWPEWCFKFWWMEIDIHDDVDLHIVDPNGNLRDSSVSIPSVFERAQVSGPIATGTWKVRIRGFDVHGSQTVYWATHVRLR